MFDRKDQTFGGIDGISRGLMTEPSTEKGVSNRHYLEKGLQPPNSGAGEMSEKVPNISWTELSGNDATPTSGDHDTPHSGNMGDRRTMMKLGLLVRS